MGTTTHIPVEVYLRSSYEPDAEYVDGEIEERPMGEFDHASWQQAIRHGFGSTGKNGVFVRCRSCGFRSLQRGIAFLMSPYLTAANRSSRSSRTRRLLFLRFCLPRTACSGSSENWKTTGQWESRKFGSSIPRTAPFIAMKNYSSCATTPSPTRKRGSCLT